jgi:hypothetical protein
MLKKGQSLVFGARRGGERRERSSFARCCMRWAKRRAVAVISRLLRAAMRNGRMNRASAYGAYASDNNAARRALLGYGPARRLPPCRPDRPSCG